MDTITLAQALIRERSVSPEDGNCQQIMAEFLQELGFEVEHMPFGPVKNLWAVHRGSEDGPTLCFAGHTDVVPSGPEEQWQHAPYDAFIEGDILHGRGAADMKGSLAAMLTAADRFVAGHQSYKGNLAFLITSDEEDVAIDGTVKVMDELDLRRTKIDYCVVGEPSSTSTIGDVVRVGRRGSLNGSLRVKGIQGHVAYPDKARNPIHESGEIIAELSETHWDQGNEFFPATSFQISNINGGTGASNVIPGEVSIEFNFRFSTESSEESLRARTEKIIARHCQEYELEWKLSGPPFLTEGGTLIPVVQEAIKEHMKTDPELSTSGGTSDGRFIAPRGIEVVELGPCNATIHKVDEQVSISSLHQLSTIYEHIMGRLLT